MLIVTANLDMSKNETILLNGLQDDKYKLFEANGQSDVLSDFSIGSFKFQMKINHPFFNKLVEKKTGVKVFDNKTQKYVFDGRIYSQSDQMENNGEIYIEYTCVTVLSFLNDSVQSYAKIQNTTPKALLQFILNRHNSQVEDYKKIFIGEVTMTNSTDNVYRYIDDTATTYETIVDKLLRDTLGGQMRLYRKNDNKLYLDWKEDIANKTNLVVNLSENMLSLSQEYNTDDILTRIFPRGAREEAGEDNTDASLPRINIASVNSGVEYIDASSELIEKFGIVAKSVVFDEVTNPKILMNKGINYLKNNKVISSTFKISTVDLFELGLAYKDFEQGDIITVKNSLLDINESVKIDYVDFSIENNGIVNINTSDTSVTMYQYWANTSKSTQSLKNIEYQVNTQTNALIKINDDVKSTKNEVQVIQDNINGYNAPLLQAKVDFLEKELISLQTTVKNIDTDLKDYKTKTDKRLDALEKKG